MHTERSAADGDPSGAGKADAHGAQIEALRAEIERLSDLFRRRLLGDPLKQEAFHRLFDELDDAKRLRDGALERPLLGELVLLIDQIDAVAPGDANPLEIVRAELLAILARRGMEPFGSAGEEFDPALHRVVATEPSDDRGSDGRILRVARPGFRAPNGLFRPAGVVLGKHPSSAS